jgi:hypothetical protein
MPNVEEQLHPIADGTKLRISRTTVKHGRGESHEYRVNNGPPLNGVTKITKFCEGDGFGAGKGFAVKEIRDSGGDLKAPDRVSGEAADLGNNLHRSIDNYITDQIVDEEDDIFMAWFRTFGEYDWLTSERFVCHPKGFGGTIDAIAREDDGTIAVYDWKTRKRDTYERNGPYAGEKAQISAYAKALQAMGSNWAPTKAYIVYVMRDGSYAERVEVDIEKYWRLFRAAKIVADVSDKINAKPKQEVKK